MRRTLEQRLQCWAELNAYPGMRKFFAEIPDKSQQVILMHYEQCMSMKEIAEHFNYSVSTARHHHNYGLFLLKRKIERAPGISSDFPWADNRNIFQTRR